MRERELYRRYHRDLLLGLAIYIAILVVTLRYAPLLPPGLPATLAHISPMLGFFLIFQGMLRWYRDADEYQRRITLENVAVAAAVTAASSFTYGFLENAGLPKLSMFVVWPLMGGVMAVTAIVRNLVRR